MSEAASRVENYHGRIEGKICYWKHTTAGWFLSFPDGTLGNLSAHACVEHEDGTLSATPSILITGAPDVKRRHGYLTRGVWNPCEDDNT